MACSSPGAAAGRSGSSGSAGRGGSIARTPAGSSRIPKHRITVADSTRGLPALKKKWASPVCQKFGLVELEKCPQYLAGITLGVEARAGSALGGVARDELLAADLITPPLRRP